jgi:hypothetical protein
MERVHPNHNIISSNRVEGTAVYGADREQVGTVDHLMIEKISGKVAYAVISFGGFLGIGEGHHPLPWAALKYDTELDGYITGITEDQLRDAPEFSDDSWSDPDWEKRVHTYYGVPAYYGV